MESDSKSPRSGADGLRALAQPVAAPLTRAAIFLVVTVKAGPENRATVRSFCGDLGALHPGGGNSRSRSRSFLHHGNRVGGVGPAIWGATAGVAASFPGDSLRRNATRFATPGDLLFHIRAKRMDLCFELATQIMARIGDAVSPADEVHGFRYFDDRDLIGFVDGTENPRGQEAVDAVLVGDEDAAFAGGSYVIVQKYLHDLAGWDALPTEAQERIIGRKKLVRH